MLTDSRERKYTKESWEKLTVIKDMVHGYIEIPKPILKEIIDSEQFQRLKDIEQTGMEALYPSATHKRFTHSLGVYHLAKKAFREFRNNIKNSYPHIYKSIENLKVKDCEQIWSRWQLLFELASLLHDCGHSPFSHTLEFIYDLAMDDKDEKILNKKLIENLDSDFLHDFGKGLGKPHERMSALYVVNREYGFRENVELLLKSYMNAYQFERVYDNEEVINDDLEFMVRMIIGCRYNYERKDNYIKQLSKYYKDKKESWYIELQLRNCIIGMLNSELDVDNMDYVVRDSKFSGYANHTVDLERLLSSFTIAQAFDVTNLNITREQGFDQCINLRNFRGDFVNGRLTGSCHICSREQNIKARGKIVLEGQKEETVRNQRIYKTEDEFSAKIEFDGINSEYVEITAPIGKNQPCAYIHFKGNLEGVLSGTIFISDFEREKEEWGKNGNLRIYFAYEQKCMSVLMSAVYNSNFEKKWIYAHHISTYTNDFLYIYLLEKYAEYIVKLQKEKMQKDLDDFFNTVEYEKIEGRGEPFSDNTNTRLENYQDIIQSKKEDNEILEKVKSVNNDNLAQTYIIIKEFIYIWNQFGKDTEEYTERFDTILQNCCMSSSPKTFTEESITKAKNIIKEYRGICSTEMQIISDILAMYDKPYKLDGMKFYKTSDRDLLAAYKNLYLELSMNSSRYGDEYKEFEENYKQLVERQYLKCMWKSQPEFAYYFSDWSEKELELLCKRLKPMVNPKSENQYLVLSDYVSELTEFSRVFWEYLKTEHNLSRFVFVPQQIRIKKFVDYEMYMKRGNCILRLKDVGLFHYEKAEWNFFYFYYLQNERTELDIFAILDWLKEQIRKEIEEEYNDN